MEIKLKNVYFDYFKGTSLSKNVLNNVSLSLKCGRIIGITGESGSGKSTLAKVICGCIVPSSGSVSYDVNMKMGYLPQLPNFSCRSVLKEINGNKECLKLFGLNESILNVNPFDLSFGEQKRLSLAIMFSLDFDVLILDEPLLFLDSKGRDLVISLIKNLKVNGKTVIVCTDDTNLLFSISDYVFVLKGGKIVRKGGKYKVFTDISLMDKCGLTVPYLVSFVDYVKSEKGIDLDYRDDLDDIMKDVYRYVR